jgi:transposase-like protein
MSVWKNKEIAAMAVAPGRNLLQNHRRETSSLAAAALKFLKKAIKRYGTPPVVVTDKCPSCHAA